MRLGKLSKAIGVAGVVAGAAYLSKSENRENVKKQINKVITKVNPQYTKKLGKPRDIQDAAMVDEGALTSVQYYNELQEKKANQTE